MKPCLIVLLTLLSFTVYAQREYMVEINPETGEVKYHSILANVNYIAMGTVAVNTNKNLYTFPGVDFNKTERLYSVDLVNGGILYNPRCKNGNKPICYNNDGKLFNIANNTLMSIEPETGAMDSIAPTYSCGAYKFPYTAFDPENQQLYTSCVDGTDSRIIKTNTGGNPGQYTSYTNKAKFDLGLVYHEKSGKLFSIFSNNGIAQLIEQDLKGGYKVLSSTKFYYNSSTIDQEQNKYVVIGFTDSASMHTSMKVFTFSLPGGQLVYTTPLQPLEHEQDNLHNIAYNKSDGKYYMLHWDHDTTSSMLNNITGPNPIDLQSIKAHPNPFSQSLKLQVKTNTAADLGVNIYNAIGMKVYSSSHKAFPGINSFVIVPTDNALSAGYYFIQVTGLNKPLSLKTLKVK